jgi:putative ABC transport system substrate-binding protein
MIRREFLTLIGGAAVAWPVVARAQQSATPVVGHMHAGTLRENGFQSKAFEQGLAQAGYVSGKNVVIEYRWAEGQYERLPGIAAELVQRRVNVIATGTPVAALAAKRATTSIPIVFGVGSDPVRDGLVDSLNHPGGNITGATFFSNLLTAKRFGLLHELVPNAKLFAALVNPKNANARMQTNDAQQAAQAMGVQLFSVNAASVGEIDKVFDDPNLQKTGALLVLSDSFLNSRASQIAMLALRHGLPTCFAYREPAEAGGLMGYGASPSEASRQTGVYVGRILKGEKPADLPVQQPTRFEFVLNMRTAKALRLSVPNSMQLLADEVIE